MRSFLLTSIAGGGIVLISYLGIMRGMLAGKELPSILESLRITLFIVAIIGLIVDIGYLL